MSFNKIILSAISGAIWKLRYTPQGTPVCSFSLATTSAGRTAQPGDNNDVTTWFRVTLWGRQAETASQYLQRGRRFISKDVCALNSTPIVTANSATHWK